MEKRIKTRICALVVVGMFVAMLYLPGVISQDGETVLRVDGSYRINIDDDGDEDDRIFSVSHDDNDAELFRIQENGKVGIGTTSPGATLHVMTSGADNHIRVQRAGYAPYMDICSGGAYCVLDCRNTWDEVFAILEDGTARLHIKKGGNIGIGTTSPGDKLDVNGDIRVRGADIKDAGGTVRITLTDNGRLDLKEDGGSTSLSIATDGKVGIGTTSPGATLHVMTSGADNHIRVQRAGSAPYMDICSGGAYCVLDCRNTWDEVFQIREDGTARLHIKKGGNVGIGTTSPDRILHIKDTSNPPLKYECTTATGKSGQDLYIPIDVNGTTYYIKLCS